ncbi:MAG: CoA transferase [Proteobacteria bacterium]|nr:CoA transferase [Pseudomonadota bacterium]
MIAAEAFASLNRTVGIAPLRPPEFSGDDPLLPTPFCVAGAAAAALGLGASAADEIWQCRSGTRQDIGVDLSAAASSLLSFALLRLDGNPVPRPAESNVTVGIYCAGDGHHIHLHGGFPHLERGTLELLGAQNTPESLAAAVAKWNAFELEDALAGRNLCGAVVRTAEEWRTSPQGRALADAPPIKLVRIGDAPPLRLADSATPLDGIRTLDLTRVLAGPSAGRTLASYGADVLGIRAPGLPTIALFDLDTGLGKRSAFLDLAKANDAQTMRALVRDAHVFIDSYRPGALAKLGFSPQALAELSPGIVHVAICCYGSEGPWANRRGWEQLAQSATGIAVEQGAFTAKRYGEDAVPKLVPAAACDYITGYLAAAGAIAALLRRIREGGSWRVEVSLCATAQWLQSLARSEPGRIPENWNPAAGLDGYFQSCETTRGRLVHLAPVVRMSKTPPVWRMPPPEQGADQPRWQI